MPRARGPVVVRGLTKFMEKQQSAARLKQQQAEREREVFLLDAGQKPARSFTIPQPFRIAAPERAEARRQRRVALRERIVSEVMAECTFKPRTKEAMNREVLRRLMEAAEALDGATTSGGDYEDALLGSIGDEGDFEGGGEYFNGEEDYEGAYDGY